MHQDFREAVGAAVGDEGEAVLDDERLREILNELPDVYTLHRRILNELENRIRHWWDFFFPFLPQNTSSKAALKRILDVYAASLPSHLFCFHPGRKARGLQTSSYPEKQSSWFSPPTSATTTEAWTCWRTAAELHLPLQPLFTSLRSALLPFSKTVLHRNLHVYVGCLNVGRPSKCQ